jgi:hypothetical protein
LSTRALWPPVLSGGLVSRDISDSPKYWLVSCQQTHLWQPPVLSAGPAIGDISGASGRVGEGNKNLVYPSAWDFKRSFRCKILRHGTSEFTFHKKEIVLPIFIAVKNPSPWPGSNPQPLGPVASILTTTPPRRLRGAESFLRN